MSYELSMRSLFWDNRASINTNLFYNAYEDYQAYLGSGIEFGDGTTGGGIANVDEARAWGIEIEGRVLATPTLTLFASASYLDTKVLEYLADPALEGGELPYAADTTLSAGFEKLFGERFSVGASARYTAEYFDDLDNEAGSADGSNAVGDYTIVNANVAYTTDAFGIRLYANNLLDEYIVTQHDGGSSQSVREPLTIGITLNRAF